MDLISRSHPMASRMWSIAAHEATAQWDVSKSRCRSWPPRRLGACTGGRSANSSTASGTGMRGGALEAGTTTPGYLAAIGAAAVGAIVVPYGEELLRCVTTTDRE